MNDDHRSFCFVFFFERGGVWDDLAISFLLFLQQSAWALQVSAGLPWGGSLPPPPPLATASPGHPPTHGLVGGQGRNGSDRLEKAMRIRGIVCVTSSALSPPLVPKTTNLLFWIIWKPHRWLGSLFRHRCRCLPGRATASHRWRSTTPQGIARSDGRSAGSLPLPSDALIASPPPPLFAILF